MTKMVMTMSDALDRCDGGIQVGGRTIIYLRYAADIVLLV